jgi:protein-disulfide isomerase
MHKMRSCVLSILFALALVGCRTTPDDPGHSDKSANAAGPAQEPGTVSPRDFRDIGNPDAPVTMIEFTDLQCPYCAQFALQTFPELRKKYIETGKLRYAARDLPLSFHEYAVPAAVAARCAGQQGAFWEYREALFRGQSHLATAPYDELADRFGLDVEVFEQCRADSRQKQAVESDAATARSFGIASTPTFVIGRLVRGEFIGETVTGALPFKALAEKIDPLLEEPR